MSTQILDIEPVIAEYLAAWNAENSETRSALINQVLASNCLYVDAHLPEPITTRELHSQFIEQFRQKFPDLNLSLVSSPDAHHNFFRFRWQLIKPNGDIFTSGVFFGEVNQDHKILKLIGFVDQ